MHNFSKKKTGFARNFLLGIGGPYATPFGNIDKKEYERIRAQQALQYTGNFPPYGSASSAWQLRPQGRGEVAPTPVSTPAPITGVPPVTAPMPVPIPQIPPVTAPAPLHVTAPMPVPITQMTPMPTPTPGLLTVTDQFPRSGTLIPRSSYTGLMMVRYPSYTILRPRGAVIVSSPLKGSVLPKSGVPSTTLLAPLPIQETDTSGLLILGLAAAGIVLLSS